MRGLRLLLLIDAAAMVAASTISDPIVGDVALAPALLVCVLAGIALLSGELVAPRRRLFVACAALSIVAPFPFLALVGSPWGARVGAAALVVLQAIPLGLGGLRARAERPAGGPRRTLAALVLSTSVLLIVSVALVWYGAGYLLPPPSGAFLRAPYLVRLTTTSAVLDWQAKSGQGPVTLRVRPADGGQAVAVRHRAMTGLDPGTRYLWSADIGGVSQAAGAFTTAPLTTAAPITLVAFGDYGSGNAHEYAVGREAAAVDPSLFLAAGDNAYLTAAPPLLNRAIFTPLRALLGEALPVVALGEHDLAWRDGSAVISALRLPGHHYVEQYGPVQVVVLGMQADSSAVAFARRTLGRGCTPACPVRFVLVHRPIAVGNPIMPVLRRAHVAAIITAHLHRYERHLRSGVLQFTLGTGGQGPGGAQFTRATPDAIVSFLAYGFLEIRIQGRSVDYRFVDQTGRVRDQVLGTVPGMPRG
jgi:hypothetical protein